MYISSVISHYITVCRQLTLVSAQKTCICPRDVVINKCTVMDGLFGGSTVFGRVENTESGNGNGNGNGNSEKIVRSESIYCQSRWKFDASVLVMGEKCYQSQA